MDSKILIVDDQQSNVRLLEHVLRRAGFVSITTATDPGAVVAMHREHHYDVILLDVLMPGLSGFDVLEALGRDAPVLIMTADPRHHTRAMQAGARDFISKPFVLADVVERVTRLLSENNADNSEQETEKSTGVAHGVQGMKSCHT
ncbi:MAG: response regulator [Acidobacteriota bacterium]|nr:response regulator [Acidobacteriota bacterium]